MNEGWERKKNLKNFVRRVNQKKAKLVKWSEQFSEQGNIRCTYFWYREHCRLRKKCILVESAKGGYPLSNMAAVLEELCSNPDYASYEIYLSGEAAVWDDRTKYLEEKKLSRRVKLLSIDTKAYYKVLATAKYLICEDSFIYLFTKREGQIYLNTWHGTPLMTLGKAKKMDETLLGNEQKNFFDADYLLCPNEFTMQCFLEDYVLGNFAKGRFLFAGYPRNEVLVKENTRENIRRKCMLDGQQVIAYLPTWRKNTLERTLMERTRQMEALLKEWDEALSDGQTVYVHQHYANRLTLSFTRYRHIRPFPENYDVYEFLAASDVLVTDYSSVLFDYALTKRKIVLFQFDREYYERIRGLHLQPETMPFPVVKTVQELAGELAAPKTYDEEEFLNKFCRYDKEGVTKALCRKVILQKDSPLVEEREIPYNGKKNVLLYIGTFGKNGLTTSASNLFHTLDLSKNNYAVVYYMGDMKSHPEAIRVLPDEIARYGIYFYRCLTLPEKVRYTLWRDFERVSYRFAAKAVTKMSARESQRLFRSLRLDTVVQFAGYDDEMTGAMEQTPCNRILYVHSDMEQEIRIRKNANREFLKKMYHSYDSVAVVTEGVMPPTRRIADSETAHLVLCNNVIDAKRILKQGAEALKFDAETVIYPGEEKLLGLLASGKKKFVTVGRFSAEKGHARLISAFERLHKEHPDTCLIIVGGRGALWNQTKSRVKTSDCPEDMVLVQYVSNPYPLVKSCDYFAFSSLYEGFGLVLAEADILGLPCFSPNLPGPRGFMQKYGGLLVDDSEDGIYTGLCACLNGSVPKQLNIDYEAYNKNAVAQFESLL